MPSKRVHWTKNHPYKRSSRLIFKQKIGSDFNLLCNYVGILGYEWLQILYLKRKITYQKKSERIEYFHTKQNYALIPSFLLVLKFPQTIFLQTSTLVFRSYSYVKLLKLPFIMYKYNSETKPGPRSMGGWFSSALFRALWSAITYS